MIFFSILSILTLADAQPLRLTVNDVINTVKRGNLSITSMEQNRIGVQATTGHLGRSFLPSLKLELGAERFQTGHYGMTNNPYGMLEARFNLFNGGRDKIENDIRNFQLTIAEQEMNEVTREEVRKARKLLWQIVYNNEVLKILDEELKKNKALKEQAALRSRRGISTTSDVLEFKIYENEILESIEGFNHENLILKAGLVPVLGLEEGNEVELTDSLLHAHDDELLSKGISVDGLPEVLTTKAENGIFDGQKRQSEYWWMPKLEAYGGYYLYTLRERDYLQQGLRDDQVVGMKLTFELFDGFHSYRMASAAYYQAQGKRLLLKHLKKKSEADYFMLREDLKHAHDVLHFIEERIKGSKEYLRLTLQEYDRGVKNSLDALTAMKRYFEYEKQYLDKKKLYQMIRADLLAMRGE